jgi:hypothetical protein
MMLLPSSLLISLFLLTTPSFAVDDGQWHASSAGGQATTTAVAAGYTTATAATKATTIAAVGSQASAAAGGDWQSAVTWPAGCETWANPCPPGAHISGGGVAGGKTGAVPYSQMSVTANAGESAPPSGYENGFTSYTTMTNSDGVITGMPPKATIAAGVSDTTLATVAKSKNSTYSTPTGAAASSTQNGFSFQTATSRPVSTGAAAPLKAMGGAAVLGAAGVIVALL